MYESMFVIIFLFFFYLLIVWCWCENKIKWKYDGVYSNDLWFKWKKVDEIEV